MIGFQPKKYKQVEWPELSEALEIMKMIRNGSIQLGSEQVARQIVDERTGFNHVNRTLRDIYRTGAKTLHMASFLISSIEDMSLKNEDIRLMLSSLPIKNSASACVSELGMLIAELDEHVIDRIEVSMLCSHELFNDQYISGPLNEQIEAFE